MARVTVYRQLGPKRRTTVPRSSGLGTGLSSSFGRMLAKLALASDVLNSSRPTGRRRS